MLWNCGIKGKGILFREGHMTADNGYIDVSSNFDKVNKL